MFGYSNATFIGEFDEIKLAAVSFGGGGNINSWASRKEGSVANSTTVSEFMAMAKTSKEAIWLSRVLSDLNCPLTLPVVLHCDNQGAIQLVKNLVYHKQTKHVDMKYFFVRELWEKKEVDYV